MGKVHVTGLWLALCAGQNAAAQETLSETVQFETADGVTIYGDLYRAASAPEAPLILFFHQGGSAARAEYRPLVGQVLARGYHALAIDQRRGGSSRGGENRTVAALQSSEYSYCDVYPDLEAALGYVGQRGFTGPRVLWGSSYSAALVVQLAARRPDGVAAVLAFSPASGDPMAGCEPLQYSPGLTVPLLVLRPSSEMEIEGVRSQMDVFQTHGHQTYVADPGRHGSSLLNSEAVGASTDESWSVVFDFIERALGAERP